jgi:hypothetical protein
MARDNKPLDPAQIDALYGLEPVLEPERDTQPADWLELECAFCGESFGTPIDLSAGSQRYIEDCQVCCQPLVVNVECDDDGQLIRGWAERGD